MIESNHSVLIRAWFGRIFTCSVQDLTSSDQMLELIPLSRLGVVAAGEVSLSFGVMRSRGSELPNLFVRASVTLRASSIAILPSGVLLIFSRKALFSLGMRCAYSRWPVLDWMAG